MIIAVVEHTHTIHFEYLEMKEWKNLVLALWFLEYFFFYFYFKLNMQRKSTKIYLIYVNVFPIWFMRLMLLFLCDYPTITSVRITLSSRVFLFFHSFYFLETLNIVKILRFFYIFHFVVLLSCVYRVFTLFFIVIYLFELLRFHVFTTIIWWHIRFKRPESHNSM